MDRRGMKQTLSMRREPPAPCRSTRVRVGRVDDAPEREAERDAAAVVSGRPIAAANGRRRESPGAPRRDLDAAGAGMPLTREERAYFEPRFGQDFADVRIHADRRAAQSAARLNANAYTLGHDIVFAAGQFAPTTARGRHLLAHELAHVAQSSADAAPVIRRDKAGGEEETYDIPEIRDKRISDSSTQEELRRIYWDHGYETAGVTFRRVGKNYWVANQILRRRKIIITDELSSGSPLGPVGEGGEEGPVGATAPGSERGDPATGTGTKSGGETGGKEGGMPGGKAGGSTTGKRTEGDIGGGGESSALDDLAALASLISDPESLHEAQKSGNKGKGAQVGSKSGFLSGWFAQVLAILLVLGGPIKKLFSKIGGFFRNQFRRFFPTSTPKALPAGGGPRPPGGGPVFDEMDELVIVGQMRLGKTRAEAEQFVLELREMAKGVQHVDPGKVAGPRDPRNLK
jgi:hypothetical protein